MSVDDVVYNLNGMTNHTLSNLFPTYDWVNDDGYENLPNWVDSAAVFAGK